jgi:hypothetical protein
VFKEREDTQKWSRYTSLFEILLLMKISDAKEIVNNPEKYLFILSCNLQDRKAAKTYSGRSDLIIQYLRSELYHKDMEELLKNLLARLSSALFFFILQGLRS